MATVILLRSDKEFWSMTPRKLFALVSAHNRANTVEEEKKEPEKMRLEDLLSLQTVRK